MNSVTQAITVTAAGLQASAMLSYSVALYAHTTFAYNEIYRGRCYTDADGSATMRIDGILRDFAYRHGRRWVESMQRFVPRELVGFDNTLHPVDDGTTFLASDVLVTVYDSDGNAAWHSDAVPVWAGFLAPWQVGELPYYAGLHFNLATVGNSAIPHLPPIATGNMWLGLSLVWLSTGGRNPELGIDLAKAEMRVTDAGCYVVAYTLQALYDMIGNVAEFDGGEADSVPDSTIDGGDADDVADDEIDGGGAEETQYSVGGVTVNLYYNDTAHPVAVVDQCASPYYVAWVLPNGGWFCRGFDGNTTVGGTPQALTITDLMDADRVVSIDEQAEYTLNSGFVTRDEYNTLCTMRYAREVYLYDSKNDNGKWCAVASRGLTTAGNVRWHNQPFTVTLKEIMHTKI